MRRQSIDVNTKITYMLELSDKDFKATITKMFQEAIASMLETQQKIESINQETENIKNGNFGTEKYNNQNKKTY